MTDWHKSRGRLQRYESAVAWRMIRRTPAITCSTWLASELAANGQPTTAIPPLFSSSIRQFAHGAPSLGSGLHLAIAGTAVGLDAPYIRSTLKAAERLSSPDSRVTVHLIGHPERYIKSLPGLVSGALDRAVFHGWLGYRDVVRIVSRVDFVVHQRPADARWVKAGFPSKVVEAWVLGTPVITNLTSDLGDYALDGFNSVVVADGEPAALAAAVARAQGQAGDFNRTQISSWADATLTPSAWASRLDSFLARL